MRLSVVALFAVIVVLGATGIIGAHAGMAPQYAGTLTVGSISDVQGSSAFIYTFTDSASGGKAPYTFTWNFGDGHTAVGSSVTHTYATTSNTVNYTVQLTVTDSATPQDTNTATPLVLKVGTSAGSLTVGVISQTSSGNTYTFSDSASGGVAPYTYSWTFGDGATAKGSSVTHTFASSTNAETYTVSLTVTDSASHSSQPTPLKVTVGAASAQASPTPDYTWLYILLVVVVVAVLLLLLLVRRRKQSQRPEEGQPAAGDYGATGAEVAPYSYQYGSEPSYAPPPPPDQMPPVSVESAPPQDVLTPTEPAPVAPETQVDATPAAAPSAPDAPTSTNCVVCGGGLTSGYCAQCNMDWSKGSAPA